MGILARGPGAEFSLGPKAATVVAIGSGPPLLSIERSKGISDMAQTDRRNAQSASAALSKVPQITVYFWIIKVLCTTVGETASDFLNVNLGFGLPGTAVAAGIALLVAMLFQFRARAYVAGIYWLTVVLISVFGTLATDILTDSMGFPLEGSLILFSAALATTLGIWYAKEGTLSIHSIFTTQREAFYWSAILFTFALGTAAGDLMAEKLGLGYLLTGIIVLIVIAVTAIAWRLGLDAVLGFWIVYILTRPLGASVGDYLSQSKSNGGLGLGATGTSVIFLAAILAVVAFLAITKRDASDSVPAEADHETHSPSVVWQVVAVAALFIGSSSLGYYLRSGQLRAQAAASVSASAPLGDLSRFRRIADDMLRAVSGGDAAGERTGADDLESAWDDAQALLRPMSPKKWTRMDNAIDDVLHKARTGDSATAAALSALVHVMDTLPDPTLDATPHSVRATASTAPPESLERPLGDLSAFKEIAERLLSTEHGPDAAQSKRVATELETAWDQSQSRLQPMSSEKWSTMDAAIDSVLKGVRSPHHDAAATSASVEALIKLIGTLDHAR